MNNIQHMAETADRGKTNVEQYSTDDRTGAVSKMKFLKKQEL
jgi:hypothetical protein